MSIIVREVTKWYGKQKALDSVTFSLRSGEIAGFIGPNGAGKTTLMKILTGYIPPSSGQVHILGQDALEESLQVRKHIGYLPENNPLYPDMYVREYLTYVAGIYRLGRDPQARIRDIIGMTGLGPEQKKKIGALSKGYRQRVGLAQALIHDPAILILDEPTSGLDPNQIIEIRTLISEAGKEKTVLLSTHIMQEVEAICDRIIIIHQGKIVADEEAGTIYNKIPELYQTVLVEFNSPIDQAKIEAVEGVIRAVPVDARRWLVQGEATRDIRGDLFNLAVQYNVQLLSLLKQEKSLEEVFQELTR